MKKVNVTFCPCIIGHHVFYKNRMIAVISKHGSTRWEISDSEAEKLPMPVLSAVMVFASEIAKNAV